MGLKQGFRISLVGLVAHDVGTGLVSGEKDGCVPEFLQLPGPVMGGAASLQEDDGGLEFAHEGQKPAPGKAMPLRDNTGAARDGDLENILGNIDSDDRILHCGLLLCFADINSGTMMPTELMKSEESIPSFELAALLSRPWHQSSGTLGTRGQSQGRASVCSSTPIRWADLVI